MATVRDESRMARKQYHLSAQQVRRIEKLRDELGLDSEAAVVRRAIEAFDPDALDPSDRELAQATAEDLITRVQALKANIDGTLDRVRSARKRVTDPQWIEHIRERTRQEVASDPAIVAGVARLIGA